MELLQQHLPGLHRLLRGALGYVYAFSGYLLGEQAHPGAEPQQRSRGPDPSMPPEQEPVGGPGAGAPEHRGTDTPGALRDPAGCVALQAPLHAQDATPQAMADLDTPLGSRPGAVSLEPRAGEQPALGAHASMGQGLQGRTHGGEEGGPGAGSVWLEAQGPKWGQESCPVPGRQGAREEGVSPGGAPWSRGEGGHGTSTQGGAWGQESLQGASSCHGEGSEVQPPFGPAPQPEHPDGTRVPLPEPGQGCPLDVSAQRSRVLLRRKGSVRKAPSLRARRPPGEPQPPPEADPPRDSPPPCSEPSRRQLPQHAGFGLAHPHMMAELNSRLRRPPPQ
ncbi:apolipoprotein B receptor [Carettochelys insculpta]|uniref:apolipoprotein B receptor n=1 Tax=Carettochelys insculpta TaxID=44489 RepID=UPI003EB73B9D